MSSSSDSEDDKGNQVRVSLKLSANVQDRSLEVPSEPIAVPADIGRKGLSAVINHLLGRSSTTKEDKDSDDSDSDSDSDSEQQEGGKLVPLNFEFILSGAKNRLLRKGVEKEARQHGLSLEQAIAITYFPASNGPELSDEHESLPDWISSLSLQGNLLCSGCYDGTLHLYKEQILDDRSHDGLVKLDSTVVSSGPIKCVDTVLMDDGTMWIATACLDHTMHIHNYSPSSSSSKLNMYGQCKQDGLSCAMTSLDFSPSSKLLASGDGHGCICIWDVHQQDDVSGSSKSTKKLKTAQGGKSSKSIKSIFPQVSMVSSHTQPVSGISWGNHHLQNASSRNGECTVSNLTHLISGSWDHSIKLWDVERQDCLITLNGSRVVSCLDTSYHSEGVVATGHPDCTIRLWDVRANDSNLKQQSLVSDNTFRPSHRAWVSSVHWSKFNPYHLMSTSHDGSIKLWDIRSSNPLHTIRVFPKDEKALCLAWHEDKKNGSSSQHGIIFAGGTDCTIKQLKL